MTRLHFPKMGSVVTKPISPMEPQRLMVVDIEEGFSKGNEATGKKPRPYINPIFEVQSDDKDYALIKGHKIYMPMEGDSESTLDGMALFAKAFCNAFSIPVDENDTFDTDDVLGAEGVVRITHKIGNNPDRPWVELDLELPKA